MPKYRVLVVDDKRAVLDSIRDNVGVSMDHYNHKYDVELFFLKVEVIKSEDDYKISDETISNLNELCREPFNLLLLDFGYIMNGLNIGDEIDRLQIIFPEKNQKQLLEQVLINPSHIVKQIATYPTNKIKNIQKNFQFHNGPIYVYTYIPRRFEEHYTSADVRKNVAKRLFKKAFKVSVIDTRLELFNNTQFDNIHEQYRDYYSYIIAKYLSVIIQNEILNYIIIQKEKTEMKYRKIKENSRLKLLAAMLLSILSGFLIPTIWDLFKNTALSVIVITAFSLFVAVAFLTIFLKKIENENNKLLK